jgi:tetratricopeptide (TPR) repeat protein
VVDDERENPESFFAELKRRRVYRVGAYYAFAAFVAWQVAEIAVPALGMPDMVLTVVVIGSIVLSPVVLALAWMFDVRRDDAGIGLPPEFRDWFRESRARRLTAGMVLAAAVVASGFFGWLRWGAAPQAGPEADARIAIFPLSTVSLDDVAYGEGIAELLVVGLDGIPGLDVLDPAAFWSPVVAAGFAPSLRAGDASLLETSRRFRVSRYLSGTAVLAGRALDVNVRIHDGSSGVELAAVRVSSAVDSLSFLVDRLIVELSAELWDGTTVPEVSRIDRLATSEPFALQSYLEAMRYMRRGDFVEAEREIEAAVGADSTFALAHIAHFRIRSWRLRMAGDPMVGLQEIVQRADRFKDRLTERGRLSVAASLALNATNGADAIESLERILDFDPDDVGARVLLAFAISSYGWQVGYRRADARDALDRVLALDPVSLPILDLRMGHALRDRDFELAASLVSRMNAIRPESALARGSRVALELITVPDERVRDVIEANLDESLIVAIHVVRRVRSVAPRRALAWSRALVEESGQVRHRSMGQGSVFQILLAAGRLSEVDALYRQSGTDEHRRRTFSRRLVAAELIGVGDAEMARAGSDDLQRFVPADSVLAYLNSRAEAWAAAWTVGAWHAARGDTVLAEAYRAELAASPKGGIPVDWGEALAADIASRLAQRRGDPDEALRLAERAYALWTIHDPHGGEWYPEPAIRFRLAALLDEQGSEARAASLYQSFVYGTWVGFYTPLAALRFGDHLERAGDRDGARLAYGQSVGLWELGDVSVVGAYLAEARTRLSAN